MALEVEPLAEALTRSKVLEHLEGGSPSEPVEWETAFAICSILSSARIIEGQLVPIIRAATSHQETADALHSLREELRHIYYHINDASYFSVIAE